MPTDAQKRAAKKYHDKFDRLFIRVRDGEKDIIQKHAQQHGETINQFVLRAIKETMEQDNSKGKA